MLIKLVTALFFYAAMATESRIDDYTLYGDLNSPQLGVDLKSGMKILFIDQKTVQRDNNQTIRFRLDVKAGSMHTTKWGTELVPELLQRLILRGSMTNDQDSLTLQVSKLGGKIRTDINVDYSSFDFEIPARHAVEIFRKFVDRLTNATFIEEKSEAEYSEILKEFASSFYTYRNAPDTDAAIFQIWPNMSHLCHEYADLLGVRVTDIFEPFNITEHLLQFYQAHYHFGNMVLIISDMNSHFRSEILTILPSSSQKFIRQEEQPRYTNIPTSFAQFVEKPIEKDLLQIIVMRRQAPQDNVQIFEKWLEFLMNERSPDSLAEILKSEKMIELTGRISVILHHEYARHVGKKINCLYILFPLTKIGRENHGRILGIYLDYIKLLFGNSLSVMRSWRMFNGLSLNFDDQVLLLNF